MELKRNKLTKSDDDEQWSKNTIKLDASKLEFLEAFKRFYKSCGTTQTRCAREVRELSDGRSKICQAVVSRMLSKSYFPKDPATLQAVKIWMSMKQGGKTFLDDCEN